jgi:hypothetical protein
MNSPVSPSTFWMAVAGPLPLYETLRYCGARNLLRRAESGHEVIDCRKPYHTAWFGDNFNELQRGSAFSTCTFVRVE